MILEDLGPLTVPPWSRSQAELVLRDLATFHSTQPVGIPPSWVPRYDEWHSTLGRDWSWTSSRSDLKARSSPAGEERREAQAWLRDKASIFAGLGAADGGRLDDHVLLHHDVRSDNLQIVDDRLVLFDWASVRIGPAEVDLVGLAPSLHMETGFGFDEIVGWYDSVRPVRDEVLLASVFSALGFFLDQAWRPPITGLPRLRRFQLGQLTVTGRWLCRLLAEDEPPWLAQFLDHAP